MTRTLLNRRAFTLVAAAAMAAPALRAQVKPEKSKLVIAVGGKPAFCYLPLTIAEQLGFFRAEGLDVEVADFAVGSRALQALAAGAADVVGGTYEHTIALQAKNKSIQSIVLMGRAPQVALGVSTRALPHYRSVADLRGRRIGVSAPDSPSNMVANLALSRAGLRAHEVSYVGVGNFNGALGALRSGQIDAVSHTDPLMTMLEQKGELRIISDTRTLKGTQEVFGGPMPAACMLASMEFVKAHPNACQALAHALVRSLKWLQTAGPSDIIKAVPDNYLLGDRALYLASFNRVREAISVDGVLPDEGPRTALKAMAALDPAIRVDKVDLSRTYTNEFARRAKERFRA